MLANDIEISGGVSDYEQLDNKPITRLTDLDGTKNYNFRELQSGLYILYGYFKPNATGNVLAVSNPTFASVINRSSNSTTYVQLFFPIDNTIQYWEMTDDNYKRVDVKLNDLVNGGGT